MAGLAATEERPWVDDVLQPVPSIQAAYQQFSHLKIDSCAKRYPGKNGLIDGSLLFALTSELSVELEARFSRTHGHAWVFDQGKQTARYVLSDDTQGDPFAYAVGVSFTEVPTIALRDPSLIHYAHFQVEAFFSFGMEWSTEERWCRRIWGLFGSGIGDQGSPWLRQRLIWSESFCPNHYLDLEIMSEQGLSNGRLHPSHFTGYGSVGDRLIDAKCRYHYFIEEGPRVAFEVLQRLYSRNAPAHLWQIQLEISYPSGL